MGCPIQDRADRPKGGEPSAAQNIFAQLLLLLSPSSLFFCERYAESAFLLSLALLQLLLVSRGIVLSSLERLPEKYCIVLLFVYFNFFKENKSTIFFVESRTLRPICRHLSLFLLILSCGMNRGTGLRRNQPRLLSQTSAATLLFPSGSTMEGGGERTERQCLLTIIEGR